VTIAHTSTRLGEYDEFKGFASTDAETKELKELQDFDLYTAC
jgi:hypothetical protein